MWWEYGMYLQTCKTGTISTLSFLFLFLPSQANVSDKGGSKRNNKIKRATRIANECMDWQPVTV